MGKIEATRRPVVQHNEIDGWYPEKWPAASLYLNELLAKNV